MKRASSGAPPLARLLALAYRDLIDDLHARLASAGHDDVRPVFGYVLLALRDRPATGAEIAALLGVTKQAASQLVDSMERGGYVARRAHPDDARAKAIAITARGRKLLSVVESIYADLERAWARTIGKVRLDAMRDDLRTVVEAAHGGQLPAVRPTP